MGIFDKLKKRRPIPTSGQGDKKDEAEEVTVPETASTVAEIDEALKAAECSCGCWC